MKNNGTFVIGSWFQYTYGNSATADTSRLGGLQVSGASGYILNSYYSYDDNGNITRYNMTGGSDMEWWSLDEEEATRMGEVYYHYDTANQLVREDNMWLGKTFVWTYDDAGNITSCKEYAYINNWEDVTGTPTKTNTYTYGDSAWCDLLTAYNGVTWQYDQIGNLTSDGTWTYTWQNGRELASMSNGSTTWNYTYDANGMRTGRTPSNGTAYTYVYNGSQLSRMTYGSNTLIFAYDASGSPMTVTYAGSTFYYVTNLQGDVIAILNSAGVSVVQYTYDAWGKVLTTTGTMAPTLGLINPLRYRGYVYDRETGLYYLQSRYYNPEIGRFISADKHISTGQGILGNNMFAYCGNNPVRNADETGLAWYDTLWDWFNTIAGIVNPVSTLNAIGTLTVAAVQGRWSDLKSDWDNGCLNPFNQSEDVALKSKVLGFYKGSTVVRQNNIGTFSLFGTIWAESNISATDLKHEYGHSVQEHLLGASYLMAVGIPSVSYYWYDYATNGSSLDYYSNPWERTADWLGGVNGRSCGYKSGALAWGIAENLLAPIVIPIYLLWGY